MKFQFFFFGKKISLQTLGFCLKTDKTTLVRTDKIYPNNLTTTDLSDCLKAFVDVY